MDDDRLSLTWNNHAATYRTTLNNLRLENTLTDVTLACDGQKFAAHKLVLVTCSDYFHSILGDVPCQHPIIYLRGVTGKEMQAIIDFMYVGQTDIPQSDVPNLLTTAEALRIKGLGVIDVKESEDSKVNSNVVGGYNQDDHPSLPSGAVSNAKVKKDSRYFVSKRDRLENDFDHNPSSSASPKRRKRDGSVSKLVDYALSQSLSDYAKALTEPSHLFNRKVPKINSHHSSSLSMLPELLQHHHHSYAVPSEVQPASPCVQKNSSEIYRSLSVKNAQNYSSGESLSSPSMVDLASSKIVCRSAEQNGQSLKNSFDSFSQDDKVNETCSDFLDESASNCKGTSEKAKLEVKDETLDNMMSCAISSKMSPDLAVDHPDETCNTHSSLEEETHFYLSAFGLGANSSQLLGFDENLETATEGKDRPFVCPICHKCFAKAAILKRHHLAHFRPYVCHICTRSFTRREVLSEHLLEHNGADLRLPCPVCGMTIKRKRNLQAHIKVKHPEYYQQRTRSREASC